MKDEALQAVLFLAIGLLFWLIGTGRFRRGGGYQPEPGPLPKDLVPPPGGSGPYRPQNDELDIHILHDYLSPEDARKLGTLDENIPDLSSDKMDPAQKS
ncbi:MAG: hypothetical protein ACYDHY_06425 [Acidiferrobacterales bacterium]